MRHLVSLPLPSNALFQVGQGMFCTSPEETFLSLAGSLTKCSNADARREAEARLALYGLELCGRYYFNTLGKLHQREKPLTTTRKLKAYLDQSAGRKGVKLARQALRLVEDGARSPMEAACSLLFCAPQRLGGSGLPRGEMNCCVETNSGMREVDRLWRKQGIGYEYQGREYHGDAARQTEDRRRNELLGTGIVIINIWYEDLAQLSAYNELVRTLAQRLGISYRTRGADFEYRQHALREIVLPGVMQFG